MTTSPPVSIGIQFPEPSGPAIELISQEKVVREYVTERGDSLADVARKYQVNESALKRANNLPDNQLRVPVGTKLVIP